MPNEAFYNLEEDKRNEIVAGCLAEFANHGYTNASTNRIVSNIGISKGSLFQYFSSKEDLYYYLVEYASNKILQELKKNITEYPPGLFERIKLLSMQEMEMFREHPLYYRFLIKSIQPVPAHLFKFVQDTYLSKVEEAFTAILKDIDGSNLCFSVGESVKVVLWIIRGGFQEWYFLQTDADENDIGKIKEDWDGMMDWVFSGIKYGLYK